ncbi:UNVERIFIED_CONTAM: hypothetical protein K2H54_025700 [Gekko kuhli]
MVQNKLGLALPALRKGLNKLEPLLEISPHVFLPVAGADLDHNSTHIVKVSLTRWQLVGVTGGGGPPVSPKQQPIKILAFILGGEILHSLIVSTSKTESHKSH